MEVGKVKAVKQGFGFISTGSGSDYFFHATDLWELPFGDDLLGRQVMFDVQDSDRGPRAVRVRPAEK